MATPITYCERCGRMIGPTDLSEGNCLRIGAGAMCMECADQLPPERVQELKAASTGGLRASIDESMSRGTPVPHGRRYPTRALAEAPERTRNATTITLIVVGAVIGGIAVVAFLLSGSAGPEQPATNAGALSPPAIPRTSIGQPTAPLPPMPVPAPQTEAAKKLAEIRSLITPDLDKYEQIVRDLKYFEADYGSAPEAARADDLLRKVNADHGALAEAALASAVKVAEQLAKQGQHGPAASQFTLVDVRFRGSPWYKDGGEQRIADAAAAIARLREAARASDPRPASLPVPVVAPARITVTTAAIVDTCDTTGGFFVFPGELSVAAVASTDGVAGIRKTGDGDAFTRWSVSPMKKTPFNDRRRWLSITFRDFSAGGTEAVVHAEFFEGGKRRGTAELGNVQGGPGAILVDLVDLAARKAPGATSFWLFIRHSKDPRGVIRIDKIRVASERPGGDAAAEPSD